MPSGNFILLRQMLVRMIYLRIQHFLHRLAVKHCGTPTQALVDCAKELLEMTVYIWVHRDAYVEFSSDIDFMVGH